MSVPSIERHDAEPITASNPPYQSQIGYRSDDYSSLRHKMLGQLQELFPSWNPDLAANTERRDMGVAFVELYAYLSEILSFYQDRRANEAFLRTAALRASLIDLSALINYRLGAGERQPRTHL